MVVVSGGESVGVLGDDCVQQHRDGGHLGRPRSDFAGVGPSVMHRKYSLV